MLCFFLVHAPQVYPNGLSLKEEIDSNNNKCLLVSEPRTSKTKTTATVHMAAANNEEATDENRSDDCHLGNCNDNNNKLTSKDAAEAGDNIFTKVDNFARSDERTASVLTSPSTTTNTELAGEELFPSLPDVMLRKLCLLRENTCRYVVILIF